MSCDCRRAYVPNSLMVLKQIGQLLQRGRVEVADQYVAEAALRPGLKVERRAVVGKCRLRDRKLRCVAKDEGRNEVALVGEDEVGAGLLVEVGDASAGEGEGRALQIRQIKGEGNTSLKPGLHRVAVGGDHFHGVGAGKRSHVQVGKLGE